MDRRLEYVLLVAILPLFGGAIGWVAAPALSRNHYIVQVAERVWYEESSGIEERTVQSTAWRATAMPLESLFRHAEEVQRRFRIGTVLFGVFCGLAAAFKIVRFLTWRAPRDHEAYAAHCLACGRCFRSCPVEHKRLRGTSP
ncbi:hypothetical protein JW916_06365 [Candidatus Sumerlaeota bacterium]|nr:hypothetical protein [Candidatus Sumerlaeota bacterium]